MGIFSRLSDIINSNINAILDRAEDPEKLVRLIVQEMEETLVEVRATAAKSIADKKEVVRDLARLDGAQGDWQRKAELALAKDHEDLAKGALVEKARQAETAEALGEELRHLDDALAKHEQDIAKLEAKLREAKAKQEVIQARHDTAVSRLKVRQRVYDSRIDDAFARFSHVERRIDAVEGEAEAYDLGRGRTLAEEIAELEAETGIEKELEALKARLAKKSASGARR